MTRLDVPVEPRIIAPMERRELRGRWVELCDALAIASDPEAEFKAIEEWYSRPYRAYHNLNHVARCLREFDRVRMVAEEPGAVELALWFHRVVYHAGSTRNEDASADVAGVFCSRAHLPEGFSWKVRRLIMVAKHEDPPVERDQKYFADVDLVILGESADLFWAYEKMLAEEYIGMPVEAFRKGRIAVLERFLRRPSVYSTPLFKELYEETARANLEASIQALKEAR